MQFLAGFMIVLWVLTLYGFNLFLKWFVPYIQKKELEKFKKSMEEKDLHVVDDEDFEMTKLVLQALDWAYEEDKTAYLTSTFNGNDTRHFALHDITKMKKEREEDDQPKLDI